MAPVTGLMAQLGIAVEVTPGVPVTPATWIPFISESLTQEIERVEPDDIIAGRRVRTSDQWDEGSITVGGDIQVALKRKGMGKLIAALIGVPVTTGSGPYTHTYTPGDLPSLTLQVGRPGVAGAVHPFTYAGMKAASGEIAFAEGDPATLGITWAGIHEIGYRQTSGDGSTTNSQPTISSATAAFTPNDIGKPISGTNIPAGATIISVQSATAATISANATGTASTTVFTIGVALASPSFASAQKGFYFRHGGFSLAGSPVKAKSGTLSFDNGLDTDRRFVGQQYIDTPLEADLRTIEGSVELEFQDMTQYRRFTSGAEVACVLSFAAGADTFTVTTNVRYDGETPTVGGRGIITQNVPFTAVASGADSTALTAVLVNTDSAY